MTGPLANSAVGELRGSSLLRETHDDELNRCIRGSKFSASITPFYCFAPDLRVLELPTTPGTAIENVPG